MEKPGAYSGGLVNSHFQRMRDRCGWTEKANLLPQCEIPQAPFVGRDFNLRFVTHSGHQGGDQEWVTGTYLIQDQRACARARDELA